MAGISKIFSSVANSSFGKKVGQIADSASTKIGTSLNNVLDKSPNGDKFQKAINVLEPEGFDNSWALMTGLMVSMVIGPRVRTAAKRNPGNKEATKDEIQEILFRDIQTVAIILLAQKAMNAGIGSIAGKITGLPMTNQKYQKVFESDGLKNKASEFIHNPIKKGKIFLKNVLDTINPIGGKAVLSNEQFREKYSGLNSTQEIVKMFDDIEAKGGNKDKVFKKVMQSLIDGQEELLNGKTIKGGGKTQGLIQQSVGLSDKDGNKLSEIEQKIQNAQERKAQLEEIMNKGYDNFAQNHEKMDKGVSNQIVSFFKDKQNSLVEGTIGFNAWLKTLAYGIEIIYLGFGLPALNQVRLEKKYLKNNPPPVDQPRNNPQYNPLFDKGLKPQEVQLFNKFIKK